MTTNTELSDDLKAAMSRIEDLVMSKQMQAPMVFTKMRELVNCALSAVSRSEVGEPAPVVEPVPRRIKHYRDALEAILRQPQETMSDGKAVAAMASIARAALRAKAPPLPQEGKALTDAQREFAAMSEPARRALVGASTHIAIGAHAKAYIEHNADQWLCFQFNTWDDVMAALRAVKAWDSAGYRAKDDQSATLKESSEAQGDQQ